MYILIPRANTRKISINKTSKSTEELKWYAKKYSFNPKDISKGKIEKQKTGAIWRINSNMTVTNQIISIITLNIPLNGLTSETAEIIRLDTKERFHYVLTIRDTLQIQIYS